MPKCDNCIAVSDPYATGDHRMITPNSNEILMQWPLEWTGLKPLAMGKIQSWLRRHSKHYQENNMQGDCEYCGRWSGELIEGFCQPCDRRVYPDKYASESGIAVGSTTADRGGRQAAVAGGQQDDLALEPATDSELA